MLGLECVSSHAFRASRRRVAIDRKEAKLQALQLRLAAADAEIADWWSWWHRSWWICEHKRHDGGELHGTKVLEQKLEQGLLEDVAEPAVCERVQVAELEFCEQDREQEFLQAAPEPDACTLQAQEEAAVYDDEEGAADADYWESVRKIGNLLVHKRRTGVLPTGLTERVLVQVASTVCSTLLACNQDLDEERVVVAASRVAVDEEPYLRNGSAPAGDEDEPDERFEYYMGLAAETQRLLGDDVPRPPRGWCLDAG